MTIITETDTTIYTSDDAYGDNWRLMLGDSCERMAEIADGSVDLSVYSPPFASLFTYSPSLRDLGNSANRAEFTRALRVHHPGEPTNHGARPDLLRPRPATHHDQSDPADTWV